MLSPSLRFLGPRRQDYLPGLLDHYVPIARGMALLGEALGRSLAAGQDAGFKVLAGEIDILEAEADKIKRRIRNHLPAGFLMSSTRRCSSTTRAARTTSSTPCRKPWSGSGLANSPCRATWPTP